MNKEFWINQRKKTKKKGKNKAHKFMYIFSKEMYFTRLSQAIPCTTAMYIKYTFIIVIRNKKYGGKAGIRQTDFVFIRFFFFQFVVPF